MPIAPSEKSQGVHHFSCSLTAVAIHRVRRLAGSANSSVLRSLGSPEELMRRITLAASASAPCPTSRRSRSSGAGRAEIRGAVWPLDGDAPDALRRHADAAMYTVKRTR